ncbi:MAG TPA: ATP-binding protein [Gemmatimonadales bacterium]|nr:ATP-binding protein [Gemmatimonadales bacterium]
MSDWPSAATECGRLIHQIDWSATALGPRNRWSPELRAYVDLILASPLPLALVWGRENRLLHNDAFATIAGPRPPALLGSSARPEGWPWPQQLLEAGFRGASGCHRNVSFSVERNGASEEAWFDLYFAPALDGERGIGGVLITAIETTTQMAFLSELFQQAPSFMAVLRGKDHIFALANETCRKLVGNREVIGLPLRVALPELVNQGFIDLLDEVYRSGKTYVGAGVKVLLQTGDGGVVERVVDFVYQPIRDGAGEIHGIFVEGTDVTGRFTADERLRIAQRAGGIGTFEWFPHSGRMEVSAEFRKLWGLAPDIEVNEQLLLSLVHPDDRPMSGPARRNQPNPLTYAEYRVRRQDTGELRWIARRGEVVKGTTPEVPQRFVGAAFDITAMKEADERLRLLNEQLERRVVTEGTERIRAEEALRQAQKMEAVGQLTGGLAHDFNNLLQGILGSLEAVKQLIAAGRYGEVDRFITNGLTSANRAASLTHRLLAFSRRQPLAPRPIRVNALIASMDDMLRRTLGPSVQMEMRLAGELWVTRCDANQLESALLNLVINARDAMPGGGRLTIQTANSQLGSSDATGPSDVSPGQYVCITVTDTGTGMTPDVMQRAFDPFFTTKPQGQGTGLGLSMIYGFAKQSEGTARLDSEVGRGTAVKLYLPRFWGEADEALNTPQIQADHQALQGEVALVVEDDPIVRDLVLEALRGQGYAVLEAVDGPGGVRRLQQTLRIDLLVTDLGLPGMNGRQVAEIGRRVHPNLKVLFMTGYAENAVSPEGFLAEGMGLIPKPFTMASLAGRIRDIMIPRPSF